MNRPATAGHYISGGERMEEDIKKVMESPKAQEEALETQLQQYPETMKIRLEFKKRKERELKAKIEYIHSLLNSL